MKKISILVLIGVATSVYVTAAPSRPSSSSSMGGGKTFYLGAGALFYNMGKVTSSDTASTSLLGQFYLPLTLTANIPIGTDLHLMPSLSYTPLGVKAADSVKKTILAGSVLATMGLAGPLKMKGGFGLLIYSISGDGSTVTRNNGGSTATFYLPGSSKSSKSIFLDLGLSCSLGSDLRIDLDAIGVSAFSSRRAISTMISVNMGVI